MPNWQELVRQRLSGLALEDDDKEEVFAELAGHLEETYDRFRGDGYSQEDAFRHALSQVKDWRCFQREIYSARTENPMTPRISRLWLPSLVTLLVSIMMLPLLERLGLNPHFLFLRGPRGQEHAFPVYTVWLMLLPFVGALGAYLSSRAGGTRSTVVISGIFPALAIFVVLLFALPYIGILEHGLEANARSVFENLVNEPFGKLGVLAGWVLVPGACLSIGVLACLLIQRRLAARRFASH